MARRTYNDELDRKNMEKVLNILSELPEYVSDYFTSRKSNTTTKTRLSYAYDLAKYFRFIVSENFLPSKPAYPKDVTISDIASLKARDIENYMEYLQTNDEDLNHKSGVARKYATLSSFFFFLYRNDLIPENPCAKVLKVRPEKDTRIIRLSPDEVAKYLDAIEFGCESFTPHQAKYLKRTSVRDLAIATLFLGTGIRVSEIVSINISDIYFDRCQISIFGKGDKYRMVAIGDETIDALKKYLKEREKIVVTDKMSADALFLSTQKKRMSVQAVEDMISKYAEAIGIQARITPHKLRKTFGTSLYNETNDIYLVAKSLGHNNVNTTKNHYVAQDEENLLQARNKVKLR